MSIEVKDLGKNQVEFSVSIDAEKFKTAVDKAFAKNAKTIALPGFRKGKAPRAMIEKMYGEGVFFEDAVNALMPEAYEQAITEANLDVVSQPEIDITEVEKDKGFTFTAKVFIRPVVLVSDYKGITAKKVVHTVEDASIDAEIDKVRERNSRIVSVEDRAVATGDTANIDFEGFVDGVAFAGGKGEGFDLVIGSGQFIPGFEEQLIGNGMGDDVLVEVSFPEDYQAEELKGKAAEFKVKINKVTTKELPEVDDEFAKDVSEFDTIAEYKNDIKEKLTKKAEERADLEFENAIVEKICEAVTVDIPESMIAERVEMLAKDMENGLMQQGINREMYLKYTGMDEAAYLGQFKENAEKQVKSMLVLEGVAKAEKMEISAEEIDKELTDISTHYGIEKEKITTFVSEDNLKKDLLIRKAVAFLKENAICEEA